MSRAPTFDEALYATETRDQHHDRRDRALSLRYEGWSHATVMAFASSFPGRHDGAAEIVNAKQEQESLNFHGIRPPTSDHKSKRKRHDDRKPVADPLWRYQG